MAEVVELARVVDRADLDRALGVAAVACRFTIADVLSILASPAREATIAPEAHSLQPGTSAWGRIGQEPR